MKKSSSSSVAATAAKTLVSYSPDQLGEMVKQGLLREEFITLVEDFDGEYVLDTLPSRVGTSYKTGEEVEFKRYSFRNDLHQFTVAETTLLSAVVMPNATVKAKEVEKAGGLPVYFWDEFSKEHGSLPRVHQVREADGSLAIRGKYTIIGAIVSRSTVDPTRWGIHGNMYKDHAMFLAYEKLRPGNEKLRYVTEERIMELASMKEQVRKFSAPSGVSGQPPIQYTLPSVTELKVHGSVDTDVRYARATFIIQRTW